MDKILVFLLILASFLPTHAQDMTKDLDNLRAWRAGCIVSRAAVDKYGMQHCFTVSAIPDGIFARMLGKSYPRGCPVPRAQLRYLRVLHVDIKGNVRLGEMVCNKAIATDVLAIFRELYNNKYPIESVRLIDDFDADDEASMRANNSSSFCYRKVKGCRKLSAHARGMAVDINTLYNPYYRRSRSGHVTIQPKTGGRYLNRKDAFPYKIVRGDLAWRSFTSHGFKWGGAWRTVKDYQHFEAPSPRN